MSAIYARITGNAEYSLYFNNSGMKVINDIILMQATATIGILSKV